MSPRSTFDSVRAGLAGRRAFGRKAVSFALIGLINTAVDYGVFLLARAALQHSPGTLTSLAKLAAACRCGSTDAFLLIAANAASWSVAMTSSYVLNSWTTFAAESGRKLRWRHYASFAASGLAGLAVNTATLIVAAQFLLLPVYLAKALAILASFAVNFSLSHFLVFRPRD